MPLPLIIFSLVVQILLPLYFSYAIWRGPDHDQLAWLIKVFSNGAFLLFLLLIGRWDWSSYYLIPFLALIFLVALVCGVPRVRRLPFRAPREAKHKRQLGGEVLLLVVFGALAIFALKGLVYRGASAALTFPLRDGWYYVAHGGNSPIVNYHNTYAPQQYALDIVALNGRGARAAGLMPTTLERYTIFGATLYSPCTGTVEAAVGDRPDLLPGETDREHASGNHVILACPEAKVLLAHMRQGSLLVQVGQQVQTGQPLGQVGNTGNTSEPHLHIHAVAPNVVDVEDAPGIPITFDGRFLIRNMFVRR